MTFHGECRLIDPTKKRFTVLTGDKPEGFTLQLKALDYLLRANVSCNSAVMISFSTEKSLQELTQRLKRIDPTLVDKLETEDLILYPPSETENA